MSSTTQQIDKIKALINSAKNPKQKKDYQKILTNLYKKLEQENSSAITATPTKPKEVSAVVHPPLEQKPVRTTQEPSRSLDLKSSPCEIVPSAPLESRGHQQSPQSESESTQTDEKEGEANTTTAQSEVEAPKKPQHAVTGKPWISNPGNLSPKKLITVKPTGKPVEQSEEKPTTGEQSDNSSSPQAQSEDSDNKESQEDSDDGLPKPFFQGIGIIKGEVTVTEEKSTIKLNGKEYRLYYIPGRRVKAYQALKHEIESTGNSIQRLIVYPKVLHLPKKDQPHVVAFQLVGFIGSNGKSTPLNQELKDGEFKLSGLWQFIPVCRTPCISVFRNFNKERLAWIKEVEPARKVKFMKSSHIPLLWKDSPVKPFRFNPKADKEKQGKPKFVQVKVKFLPGRDVFGFVEELAEARDKAPGFLKASKKLKTEAMAAAKETKNQKVESKPENLLASGKSEGTT